jgi:hypothetical protein
MDGTMFIKSGVISKSKILHIDELHKLYSLCNIIWLIKSRRVGWTRHEARMEANKFLQNSDQKKT